MEWISECSKGEVRVDTPMTDALHIGFWRGVVLQQNSVQTSYEAELKMINPSNRKT